MSHRAIVFDLGGVLLDAEEAHEHAARLAAQHFRLSVPLAEWQRIRGSAYEDFFCHVLASPPNAQCGVDAMQVVAQAYDLYHEQVQDSARLFPQVIDVLKLSRALFEFVAVATSSEWRLVDAALQQFRLASYFDYVISGDHITQKKPAPEVFLVVAWLMGVKPSSMVVVEDSVHGIRAARLARTHVIGIASNGDGQALLAANAHHVVRSHRELISYIHELERKGGIVGR